MSMLQDLVNRWVKVNKSHVVYAKDVTIKNITDSSKNNSTIDVTNHNSITKNDNNSLKMNSSSSNDIDSADYRGRCQQMTVSQSTPNDEVSNATTIGTEADSGITTTMGNDNNGDKKMSGITHLGSPIRTPRAMPIGSSFSSDVMSVRSKRTSYENDNNSKTTHNMKRAIHRKSSNRQRLKKTHSHSDLLKEKFNTSVDNSTTDSKNNKPNLSVIEHVPSNPKNNNRFLNHATFSQQLQFQQQNYCQHQQTLKQNYKPYTNRSRRRQRAGLSSQNKSDESNNMMVAHDPMNKKKINNHHMPSLDKKVCAVEAVTPGHESHTLSGNNNDGKSDTINKNNVRSNANADQKAYSNPIDYPPNEVGRKHLNESSCHSCMEMEKRILMMKSDIQYLRSMSMQNEFTCRSCNMHADCRHHNLSKNSNSSCGSSQRKSSNKNNSFETSTTLVEASQRVVDLTARHQRQIEDMTRERVRWQNTMHLKLSKFARLCKELNEESSMRKQDAEAAQAELLVTTQRNAELATEVEFLRSKVALYEQQEIENKEIRVNLRDKDNETLDRANATVIKANSVISALSNRLNETVHILENERRNQSQRRQIIFPRHQYQNVNILNNDESQFTRDRTKTAVLELQEFKKHSMEKEKILQDKCNRLAKELQKIQLGDTGNSSSTNRKKTFHDYENRKDYSLCDGLQEHVAATNISTLATYSESE